MKNNILTYSFLVGVLFLFTISCKKSNDVNPAVTVTDIDGNIYNPVNIGDQWWMVGNLKTTKYNDGTAIPFVTDDATWMNLLTPGYCWYDNDVTYKAQYGALYNFHTVKTGKLCPTGWHVPSATEWNTLIEFLGGKDVAGFKMTEEGTTHWDAPNPGTNESRFTALPGGYRFPEGTYFHFSYRGYWWTTTATSDRFARFCGLYNGGTIELFNYPNNYGFSVRCIKD